MSLDKWLKPEEKKKETKKKSMVEKKKPVKKEPREKASNNEIQQIKSLHKGVGKLSKFVLTCSKCKYQKTIMKKQLTDKNKTCPKCNNKMEIEKT